MIPLANAVRQSTGRARRANGDRGAAIVEFAIVLPLFLALVFGMLDGGRLMMARWIVTYSIDRGGRVASLRGTTTLLAVQTAVSQSASLIGLASNSVAVDVPGRCAPCITDATFNQRAAGDAVRVYLNPTYTFKRALPFVFKTATISLSGSTLTTVE